MYSKHFLCCQVLEIHLTPNILNSGISKFIESVLLYQQYSVDTLYIYFYISSPVNSNYLYLKVNFLGPENLL